LFFRTDDPIADYDRYCAEQQRELDKLPKCCECHEPIQSSACYEFNGELICPQCLVDNHRKRTDDYIE
jgi:formylmethanofuran dehydrogenase subunit E